MYAPHKRDNNSTTFKTIKANILDLIKYQQALAAMNGIQLTSWQALKEGIIATGKAMFANPTTWMVAGLTSIAIVAYKCSDAIKEVRNKAEELNTSFSSSKSEIDDYKSKINDLHKTINDSESSIEDVTTARQNLMTIQSELIKKFGDEKEAIDLITDSINGQSDALDILTQKQWQTAKNEFNKSGFWNDIANMSEGYSDNIDRMLNEYEGYKITIDLSKYGGRLFTEGYDEFKQTLIDDFGATISNVGTSYLDLTGNIDEVYQKILNIQNLLANNSSFKPDDSFNAYLGNLANDANKLANQYEDFYKQYVLYEEIFKNSDYTDSYKQIVDAYSDYQDAFATGNEKSIKKAQDNFSNILTQATANISDDSVIDYFNSMYPDLQEVVGNWKFETTFTANTEYLKENVSKYLSDLGGLNSFDLKNFDYNVATEKQKKAYDELNSVAYTYGLTIEQLIDKLVNMGLVQDEEYQRLVDKFGKENIAKIAPEDLTFAYQIKNVGNMSFKEFQAEIQRLKDEASNPDETDILSFSEAWSNLKSSTDDATKGLADNLTELAEKGQLTVEALSKADTTDFFKNLGISAEESTKQINALVSSSTQLQSMSSQISKMSDMLADKKNGTTASADDLASFDVEVRGLESWDRFERVMGSSKSTMEQCKKAANDLATEWVSSNNFLSNLNDTNKDYYITQLKNMGIENARSVVTKSLAEKHYALELSEKAVSAATSDMAAHTNNATNEFLKEHDMSQNVKIAIMEVVAAQTTFNNQSLDVSGKISSLEDLIGAYLGVAAAAEYAAGIDGLKKRYELGIGEFAGLDSATATERMNQMTQQNYSSFLERNKTEFKVDVSTSGSNNYNPQTDKKKKGGGSGSSKEDTKQEVDWISRLLDVLQKKIDATKAKFDNLFTLKSKKNNLNTQIKQTQTLLNATTIAANKYLEKANSVGLSDALKKKVQNGSYDISEYSSDTADKISKYQDYLDKYKELIQKTDELKTNIRELNSQSIQLDLDNANAKKDRYDALIESTSSAKTKISYLKKQYKCIEDIYKYEIDLAELEKDTLKVKQLEIEKEKELRENTIAQHQAKVDQAQSYLDLYSSKIDAAITAASKNKLEKEKVKYIKQSYDYQIKIAKEENDTLKVSQLKVEKEKELLAVKKEILQNTLDQNEKEKELLDAKYQNATTAKDKNKIIDKRSKLDNKDVSAYRDSYNDAKKTLSSTIKSVNKTTSNAKSLSDSDRKKIDSYVQSGKVIPESLLKKVKAVDNNWYDTLVNYNNKYADRSSTLKAIKNSKVSKGTQDNLEKAINSGKTISKKTLDNVKKKDPALYKNLSEWNNEQKNRQNIIKKISSTKTLTSSDKKKIKSLVDGKKTISDSLLKKVASANPTLYAKLVKYNADLEYRDDTKYNLDVAVEKDKTQKRQDAKEKFDNIDQEYSMKVGFTSNKVKAFQDQVSLLEAKGMEVGSRLYTKQMELNQVNINRLTKEYSDQMKELSNIDMGTPEWYAAQEAIFNTTSEINSLEIENANLQKSINQLKFDRFDDLLNKLNDIVDETDFLIDMLDSENFFDDNGKITDDGITAMGMYAQKRDIYKSEAEKYKQMQAELDQMYANGDIGIIDYETKMREYKSGQMDMAKAAEDMNKSIINLVSDGLEKQNQALSESIQKQKDLLKAEKDLKSFQDSLNDANKNISRLERQYEILQGDDSEENRKRLREIKSQLEDAKKSRDDLLYDKSIEDQEKNLDDMYDAAVKSSEEYLSDSAKVLIDACGLVNTNTETVSKNIERISKETGVDISTNITDAWKQSGNAVSNFGNTVSSTMPGVLNQISLVTEQMRKLAEESEKASKALVKDTVQDYTKQANTGKASLADIKAFISSNKQKAKNDKSAYYSLNQYIYDKTNGYILSKENEKKLAQMLNVDIKTDLTGEAGKKELEKIRDALKLAGFSKGGVIPELSDAIRLNGDSVVISGRPGERMLTEQQNGYWEKWTQSLPYLMNLTDIIKPNVNIPTAIPTVNREQSPVYNIDSSITVDGVATNEIVKDMANVAKKQAENVISEINRRTYAKGVRWK